MLIDHVKLNIKAGKGGDGVVRWRQEKGTPYGGPAGGDGGKGGDVYLRVVRNIHALAPYKSKPEWAGNDGEAGKKRSMHGSNGEDTYLNVPIGAIVHNEDLDIRYDCTLEGADILILRGGRGGYGNEKFKSATNRTPEEYTPGQLGEYARFNIELDLIADIGIIGLPNAGKSSLLNTFTRAGAKIGDYAFTTLEPNLGVYHGIVLADIPGLIEGASDGKGLGHRFLKHIKRTDVLMHLVSSQNPDIVGAYATVRYELGQYDADLLKKTEIIVISQSDRVDAARLKDIIKQIGSHSGKKDKKILTLSLYDDASIKELGQYVRSIFQKAIPESHTVAQADIENSDMEDSELA